jgi:hypothetical protein
MNVDYGENAVDYIIAVANTNTEYPLLLPEGTKAIEIQCRDATDVRIAFAAGKVAGSTDPYRTIKSGSVYSKDKLYLNATTLYVACGSGSKTVEVRVWS